MAGGKGSPETEKGININFGFLDGCKVGAWPGPLGWLKILLIKLVSHLLVILLNETPEEKFSKKEEKRIRQAVREQIDSSDPWIKVEGVSLPRMGRIFRIKADAGPRYGILKPGSLVFVNETIIAKEWLDNPERMQVDIFSLDFEGKVIRKNPMYVLAKDLEPIENEKDLIANWSKAPEKQDFLFDGEAVELVGDIQRLEKTQQGTLLEHFPRGLKGIIDRPDFQLGASPNDINASYQREFEIEVEIHLTFCSGNKKDYLKRTFFRIPLVREEETYSVYVPEHRTHIKFSRSELRRRDFDKEALNRVVMSEETRKKILSLVHGKEEVLDGWGIKAAFSKGRGEIFFAYGESGFGKTITGEALAEYLGRPLYYVDWSDFGITAADFEKGLKKLIDKINRWNAVCVIDEAEIILESRDVGFDESKKRVVAVLRNLETLERGILWMTSNRFFAIDEAIESRIRTQIYFPPFTKEQRKEVWKLHLPKDLPVSGLERLEELVKIPLSGREIRNTVINAAKQASAEGLDKVPVDYLFEWAKSVVKNKEIMKKTRSDGGKHGPIGFHQNK